MKCPHGNQFGCHACAAEIASAHRDALASLRSQLEASQREIEGLREQLAVTIDVLEQTRRERDALKPKVVSTDSMYLE